MPQTMHGLMQQYVSNVRAIYGSHLRQILLYGSFARGDYNSDSDVDVMILLDLSDTDIKVDDGFISYYMNKRKAWDNFYPIPKDVVKWCETKGYQMLNQEER